MTIFRAVIAVLAMAAVTYIIRALPLALCRKQIKSVYFKSFLYYVPYAVLASLTFPDVFYSTGSFQSALCGTIVAVILAFFHRSLVTVAAGAIITVYLVGGLL